MAEAVPLPLRLGVRYAIRTVIRTKADSPSRPVIPAKAGIHGHGHVAPPLRIFDTMDSGLRRNDERKDYRRPRAGGDP